MRCQRAEPTVVAGHEPTGLKTVVALLLCAGASVRPGLPPLRAQTAAPDITVVANPALRPTAVLLPHFQFWVAVDTAAQCRTDTAAPSGCYPRPTTRACTGCAQCASSARSRCRQKEVY